MAKKKEIIEEPVFETPVIDTPVVEETVVVSRSNGFDVPKPQPEQIGHTTRAFRG
jgi:hypothetical protein